jgi:DNA-binding CsgD family transcriptional regulator
LQWAARGKCRHDIAVILDISPASVDSYLHNALERLGASNELCRIMGDGPDQAAL